MTYSGTNARISFQGIMKFSQSTDYLRNMNYQEATEFLFNALPMYQRVGNKAFKKDLGNTLKLCEALGNPQAQFKSVHIAGTNGKGSCSHMLAAVLQSAGYKVGLYTSPHLKRFTERIKVNGSEIGQQAVANFVNQNKKSIDHIRPSFFEMTVVMAFDHFAREKVDIAVIEVGLGGRLDSTNVITPEVSLITNIGMDHMDMLGNTLPEIAFEKAGIIKDSVPVIVSEKQPEVAEVFERIAKERNTVVHYASEQCKPIQTDLKGPHQLKNSCGVQSVVRELISRGWDIPGEAVRHGLGNASSITGLKGRWQQLNESPITICDTGHNIDAFKYIIEEIGWQKSKEVHMILGFVQGKDVASLLNLIPETYHLTFCVPNVPRGLAFSELRSVLDQLGVKGDFVADVNEAVEKVRSNSSQDDLIFIGGSTFVVAELDGL